MHRITPIYVSSKEELHIKFLKKFVKELQKYTQNFTDTLKSDPVVICDLTPIWLLVQYKSCTLDFTQVCQRIQKTCFKIHLGS